MRHLSLLVIIAGFASIVLVPVGQDANGHPLTFTATTLTLSANDSFQVDLQYDLDALALGVSIATDDAVLVNTLERLSASDFNNALDRLKRLFERRVRVRFDGTPVPFSVDFPDHGTPRATGAVIPTVLGLTARLTGTIPEGAQTVEFFASRAFAEVHLTIIDETRDIEHQMILEQGARSTPFQLVGQNANSNNNSQAQQYFWLGVRHIIPDLSLIHI